MATVDFTLNKLSADFYIDYNTAAYPEIENKPERPYLVLVIHIDGNTFALPFRSNIRHDYCYKFVNSDRETDSVTGIDFTKAVIINKLNYIGDAATIDNKEYRELRHRFYFIVEKFKKYLKGYISYKKNGGNKYVASKYRYCTLKYFHTELGI